VSQVLLSKSMIAIAKVGFWLTLIVLTYLFLVPPQYLVPDIFDWWDKLQHSLAFGVLTFLGLIAYCTNQIQVRRMVLALVSYGALIEILQSVSGWRYGEFRDWLADLLGIFIAVVIFRFLRNNSTFAKLIGVDFSK
jgi:VanZ family protein